MTSPPTDEPAFADLLDELLADLLNGDEPDLVAVAARHPAAAHRIDEAYRLAGSVAGRRASTKPVLSGYQIVRELGRGGMGTVYLARQQDLDREVAIKVLPHSFGLSTQSRQRFLEEAKALARVHHEHIVGIHRIVDDGELLAFEMEFVDGPSLQEVLSHLREVRSKGTAPTLQHVAELLQLPLANLGAPNLTMFFVQLGRAIGHALGAVHAAGFVHRDVKPANILLRQNGQPVLADFGLVRDTALERSHKTGFVGTPVYSSPEQLRGGAPIGASTDVYALGVTLYECLTLAPPFAGRTTTDLLHRIESGKIPPLRRAQHDAPRDLETILEHAMELEPHRRYQDGDDFADDLQRMLDLLPIHARPASLLRRAGKFVRRNRRPLLAGCLGAALVALGMLPVLDHVQAGDRKQQIAQQEVRAAQQELLSSEVRLTAWQRSVWGNAARRVSSGGGAAAALQRCAAHYQRALDAVPDHDQATHELPVIRMALWLQRVTLDHADSLRAALDSREYQELADALPPLSRQLAEASAAGTTANLPVEAELQRADDRARASFGLLAFLIGELRWCELAWQETDTSGVDEPLRDAVLGLLYLTDGAPERAYVRLRSAQQALPDAMLALEIADAALATGETRLARRWLERAATTEVIADDVKDARRRVTADLELAEGNISGARRIYRDLARDNLLDPTPQHRLAQLAIREGRADEAAAALDELLTQWPAMTRLRLDRARLALQQGDVPAYVRQVVAVLIEPLPQHSQGRTADMLEILRIGGLDHLHQDLRQRSGAVRIGRAFLGGELPLAARLPEVVVAELQALLPAFADAARCERRMFGGGASMDPVSSGTFVTTPLLMNRLPGLVTAVPPWTNLLLEGAPHLAALAYPQLQPLLRNTLISLLPSTWSMVTLVRVAPPIDLPATLQFGAVLERGSDWNGDGVTDLLVAATSTDVATAGAAMLVDGRTNAVLRTVRGQSPGHIFGYSLAVLGDIDGDGLDEWLVGCPAGNASTRDGIVEIRCGRDGHRIAEVRQDAVAFGVAVCAIGDQDQDGCIDFAVGSPPIVRNNTAQGSVTIYSGRTRKELRRLHNQAPGVWFGASLVDVGDSDGDGVHDLAVGGNFGKAPGRVVLYSGRTGEALHTWSDEATDSGFGVLLKCVGDLDGDGSDDLAISAVRPDAKHGTDQVLVYSCRTGQLLLGLRGERAGTQFGLAVTPFRVPNSRTPWLAVSAPLGGQGSCGTVHFFDSQGGLRSWLQGPGALSRFGTWLVAGDDLDGDGHGELFLASPGLRAGHTVSRINSATIRFPR